VAAIRTVAAGEALLAPAVTRRVIEAFSRRRAPTEAARDLERLSVREREVLQLVARGQSNAEVAAELFVGEATVKTHLSSVFAKLGLRDRVGAVIYAYEAGLVEPGQS
jgi:DNA-binding NarL/FixJ family response regulator